jgi:hypothetical protein
MKVGLDALLTPENCAVLLIDHQRSQLANVNSHEPTMVINNVTALAKTSCSIMPALLAPSLPGSWKRSKARVELQRRRKKGRSRIVQSTQTDVKEYSYFAGNQWRKAANNQVFEVHEPYSGKLFARVVAGSARMADFSDVIWINSHSGQRQYPF